jgi:hypothetical protein
VRSPARLALAVIILLATDVVLSWMVIQGAYIYLGMVWHGLAKEFLPGTSLAEHARQFRILRYVQGAVWLLTAMLSAVWFHRVRRNPRAPDGARSDSRGGAGIAWCCALLLTAFGAELVATLLAEGAPLDLGGPMQMLLLAQCLQIAGAVVGIGLVRRITRAPSTSPGPRRSTCTPSRS